MSRRTQISFITQNDQCKLYPAEPNNLVLTSAISMNKPFPFLKLPREIRDQIYFHTIGDLFIRLYSIYHGRPDQLVSTSRVFSTRWQNAKDRPSHEKTMQLLLLSRQFSTEIAPVLYSTSIFNFNSGLVFQRFLSTVNPRNLDIMTKLYLTCDIRDPEGRQDWDNYLASNLASRLKGLRSLVFYLVVSPSAQDYNAFNHRKGELHLSSSRLFPVLRCATLRVSVDPGFGSDAEAKVKQYLEELGRFVMGGEEDGLLEDLKT